MNKERYRKNLDALRKNNQELADIIENRSYMPMEEIEVYSEKALSGELIFKVKAGGRILYIDGKYNPEAVREKWFLAQKKFEYESVVLIIGFGNAMYLKRLIKETRDSVSIMVYEPCINIFIKAMDEIDLTEIFEDRKIELVIDGVNHNDVGLVLNKIIVFDKLTLLHNLILGNYATLFPEQVKTFLENERKCIQSISRQFGTIVNFTDVNGENVLNNISYLYDNYTVVQLRDILPENVPSIIVAAGPSLNKNILDLRQVNKKACIIATDTAIKPLLNNGIIPDFIVIVDGKKPGLLFEHELLSEVPMIMSSVVSKDPVNMHKGKKFFSWDGSRYEAELIKEAKQHSGHPEKIDMCSLPTGGSVATTAFSFAKLLGSKTIILVGQDLAFTGNKTHADGTFKEKMDQIDTSSGEYIEVEDIYGGTVLTRGDYKSYLDWFNEQIPALKDVKVIDATEGGAKITGTEILTLKEAVKRECTKEFDLKALLDQVLPIFQEEAVREKIREFYHHTLERLLEVKKEAENGIKYYNKMINLCNKKKFDKKEFLKLTKKINRITEFMDHDGVANMVIDSLRDIDYTLRSTIYTTEDNDRDEGIMIGKQGKLFLEAMVDCIDNLYSIADLTVAKVGL